MLAVVVDGHNQPPTAQLHARARGGAAEGHPLFLHILVEVDGSGPGGAVVVRVDHLQEAGARGQQALVGVFTIRQEHIAAGLFLAAVVDSDVAALRDVVERLFPGRIGDCAVLVPGVLVTGAVVQQVAPLSVDADPSSRVGLANSAREVVN